MTELDFSRLISILSNPPKMPYPVVLPDFFVDHFVLVPTFDQFIEGLRKLANQGGGNLLGNEQFIRRGGNCVNTAAALAALGADARLIVTTDEYGASLLNALAPDLDLTHVHTTGRLSSTVSIETEFEGRKVNLMVSDSGSASDFKFTDLSSTDLDLIAESGLVALVNLNHNKQGANLAKDLFKWVQENTNAITFMDIGDPSNNSRLIGPLLENAIGSGNLDVLGLNENEVGWLSWSLTGQEKWLDLAKHPDDWIKGASLIAQETGVKIVLHTQYFSSIIDDQVTSAAAFQVEPRVSCGSGDVFNAGFLFGLLAGLQSIDQLILANAAAALYISSTNAIPPTRDDVIHYLKSKPAQSNNGKKLLM